ncbi:uncharacterized protein BDW47DRAFT_113299 [Aspergillus candidus]|uniref:C2H2-type domain-containing protein n=1 Tax=Aspergillus candidus TaxID=41067 RepID=A0A2I2EZM1_ASPCN|nr:hypothetical protein BDW47DRAFT_113299 [Aspergillus candidus]PLB33833.1 hypothetical protein BDW47DRAFT_113299 [Aspergillus candidus]
MAKRSRSPSLDSPLDTPSRASLSPPPSSPTGRSKIHLQDPDAPVAEVMRCSLPPHRETLTFPSYEDYEVHYRQTHVNRCVECGKNFPTDRFLDLHIEENHDPLIAAKRERGEKTYGCFVEDCERKCSTPQKRRMHLIDKHMFPKTYNFHIVNDGLDKQTSMLRPRQSHRRRISNPPSSPQEGRLRHRQTPFSRPHPHPQPHLVESSQQPIASQIESTEEDSVSQLEKSMAALRFVPASVSRQKTKTKTKSGVAS